MQHTKMDEEMKKKWRNEEKSGEKRIGNFLHVNFYVWTKNSTIFFEGVKRLD